MSAKAYRIEGGHTVYVPIDGKSGYSQDRTAVIDLSHNSEPELYKIGGCVVMIDPRVGIMHLEVPQGETIRASVPQVGRLTTETVDIQPESYERRKELDINLKEFPDRSINLRITTPNKMPESVWILLRFLSLNDGDQVDYLPSIT